LLTQPLEWELQIDAAGVSLDASRLAPKQAPKRLVGSARLAKATLVLFTI
jgi:hypothetical protein